MKNVKLLKYMVYFDKNVSIILSSFVKNDIVHSINSARLHSGTRSERWRLQEDNYSIFYHI